MSFLHQMILVVLLSIFAMVVDQLLVRRVLKMCGDLERTTRDSSLTT
jgi:hypothetical protein